MTVIDILTILIYWAIIVAIILVALVYVVRGLRWVRDALLKR